MDVSVLPHVTAAFDALCLVFLLAGYALIRQGNRDFHKLAMIGAVSAAAVFLVLYVIHHLFAPLFAFRGPDSVRPFYFAFLFCHVVLAAAILPFVYVALRRAVGGNFDGHKRVARRLLPVWIYTSVSGLVVYALLYHIYPPPPL